MCIENISDILRTILKKSPIQDVICIDLFLQIEIPLRYSDKQLNSTAVKYGYSPAFLSTMSRAEKIGLIATMVSTSGP